MKKYLAAISLLTLMVLLALGCSSDKSDSFSLTISRPLDESVVYESRITVSGETEPDAVVSINGIITDVDYQGKFSSEVNLDAGPNIIEVVASDLNDNEESVVLAVIYAAELPLTVTEPLNESVVTSQTIEVQGVTKADAVVSVNGEMVSVDGYGYFIQTVTLETGPNYIEVIASDFQDNTSSVTTTVIYNP